MEEAIRTTTNPPEELDLRAPTDDERLRRFGEELDRVRTRVEAEIGDDDVRYVKRMNRLSRALEVAGRALIHLSVEPFAFGAGVVALWLHKQLQATEIGHTALHGAYDKLPGAEGFRSETFRWKTPIDEESWRYGHNVRHHGSTNVAGRDADIHFGPVRLTERTPWAPKHVWQLPFTLLVLFPNFTFLMNLHFTGLSDVLFDNGQPERLDFLPDRSAASKKRALWAAARKYAPYYSVEYLFFPALAGPFFWKVLLGNWLSEVMRDVYSAATIFCGHIGERVRSYPPGTKAGHRGAWYAMQIEASNDFEVSWPVSVLCGGLDRQIEHHLFPKLPPQRLRQIAPEVRALCERYGVEHRTDTWGATLRKAFAWILALSRRSGPFGATREAMRSMS